MSQTGSGPFPKAVRVEADLASLLKNFGEVFSGETIWIRELLQNGRRAGAARIDLFTDRSDPNYLRIADNGSGVADFQALLTMGRSGWRQEVIERENPFGLGFYAALYAAVTVEIRSQGQRLLLNTKRVLAGDAVEPAPCEIRPGTVITLHLKKPLPDSFEKHLEEIVSGFPTPVCLNGVPLPRPYALDVWKGLRFELPEATALVQLDPDLRYETGITFLQGQVLSKGGDFRRSWPGFDRRGIRAYVHLQGERWRVRVPDRDALYDDGEARERIAALQKRILQAAADQIVAQGEVEKYFECLLEWGCFEVVRDLPIPERRWGRIVSPAHLPHYDGEGLDDLLGSLPASKIPASENGLRFIREGVGLHADEETLDHLFAAYAFGIPILDAWNDPEHWFAKSSAGEDLEEFYRRKLSVSVEEQDLVAEGSWWGKRVVICRRFFLTLEGYGTKEITEDAFLDGAFWIIDRPLHYHYPIDQAFYFQTQGEDFDESGFDAAMENFRANLAIIKRDPAALIQSALEEYAEALDGGRFVVEANRGEIRVEALERK
ncbi:hypothetical protein [Candidatus Manganitrophus noduliformans]|uniref:ATP-binding protein n=1 Tax=Candidatus Manganitrophus noduliformans TaxID=2606439 RepID=A0A7X6ICX1_9BACT|nr:hypothetical protein [Candidatus Manganitrophus noduliformans]NKE72864.1 hypothetical protein [Candidatus Manganitrophus noduliformans]